MTTLLNVAVREKRHGVARVLQDVRLDLDNGEILAVLGASGCGKSTLLRLIAGLDRDFDGTIEHRFEHDVGFVFQEPRLMPWLSVADNVAFPLGPGHGADARVRQLLADVGLAETADYYPKQLSGGMAQRVAIARALAAGPKLLLLDEPFSALDVLTRAKLHRLVQNLVSKYGVGAILVTHDPDEALNLAQRVIVLATPNGEAGSVRATLEVPSPLSDVQRLHLRQQVLRAIDLD